MSVEELERQVSQLPAEEMRRFASWWQQKADDLLGDETESEVVRSELLRRKADYETAPAQFDRVGSRDDLNDFFAGIRREVSTRASSTRTG